MSRHAGAVVGLLIGAVVGASGGAWAGVTLLSPPADVLESPGFTLVEASRGVVGQALRLNTSVQWKPTRMVTGASSGTVTTHELKPGSRLKPGDVLYTVDLRPVVVGKGAVPAFRDLAVGDEGRDVAQLQALLADLGYYVGDESGIFTPGTQWAVKAWQHDLGVERSGVVLRGDVIYVPDLPLRAALTESVDVGATVGEGQPVLELLPDSPSFTVALAENQVGMVPEGSQVELRYGDHKWEAKVVEVRPATEESAAEAVLINTGQGAICGEDCGAIPLGGATLVSSVIEVVPEESGVIVPAASVVTRADGTTGVVLAGGEFRAVTLGAAARGMAVVEGIESGVKVRTPGDVS